MATQRTEQDRILIELTRPLDAKVRTSVMRRHDAMMRELAFLTTKQDERLLFIRSRNWSDARLSALFCLNSMYQEVLGPLDASARTKRAVATDSNGIADHGLGSTCPILHGSQRFDSAHTVSVKNAVEDFFVLVSELGFRREWMVKNTCGDLVYWIGRHERELNADFERNE